jgi:hypothetical protein
MNEFHGDIVVKRHDKITNELYNRILCGDHFKFSNWKLIGGLGLDISTSYTRVLGVEVRYNYGLKSIVEPNNLEPDTFKLRDNTLSVLLHAYFRYDNLW